jgi:DNA-binding SARP family transcriptional activator
MIDLRLLGALDLRNVEYGAVGTIVIQPKRLALLIWLAASNAFQRRDRALALFWQEHDTARARAALNRALHYLRNVLGEGVVLSRGDEEIGLNDQRIWCDVAAFRRAIASGLHRHAIKLYQGDLLPGFFVSGAAGFERWLDQERDRLRDLACGSARHIADRELAAGNLTLAANWMRWALQHSPFDEAAVQSLMTVLDAAGDRAGAIRSYEQFARHLATELAVKPSPETRALADAIRLRERQRPGVAPPRADPELLVRLAASNGPAEPDQPPEAPASVEAAGVQRPSDDITVAKPATRRPPSKRARVLLRWASVGIIAAVAIVSVVLTRAPPADFDAERVVVLLFQNRTGNPGLDALARLASDRVTQSLADVARAVNAVTPGSNPNVTQSARGPIDLMSEWGAGMAVIGTIDMEGDEIRIRAAIHTRNEVTRRTRRLAPLRAGPVWAIGPLSARKTEVEPALRELRQRVTGGVAALKDSAFSSWLPLALAQPPTFEAYTELVRGHRMSGRPDLFRQVLVHYDRAAALDTAFRLPLLYAIRVHRRLGDEATVDSLQSELNRRRGQLEPLLVHLLDWTTNVNNPDAAYRAIERAAALSPAFLPSFAFAARNANRPRETLAALKRLRAADEEKSDRNEYLFLLTDAYHQLGEHQAELAVALRSRQRNPQELDALWHEVRARAAIGDQRRVMALLDDALSSPRDDSYTPGATMLMAAQEFRAHDHPHAASEALERALAWYGTRARDEADRRNSFDRASTVNIGSAWSDEEPVRQAMLAQADELFRRYAAHDPRLVEVTGILGAIAARRGDVAEARAMLDSLAILRSSNKHRIPEAFYADAIIRASLNDAEGAVRSLRDWIGGQGFDLHAVADFQSLWDHPQFREFIRPKG